MELTPKQKKVVEKLRNNPDIKWKPGLTDEEILAQARFVETGGNDVYDSVEEYKAAMKKQNIDDIEEV